MHYGDPMILHTFTNADDGIESWVACRADGSYFVGLKDLDSGETLPQGFIVSDLNMAIQKAKKIAGVK